MTARRAGAGRVVAVVGVAVAGFVLVAVPAVADPSPAPVPDPSSTPGPTGSGAPRDPAPDPTKKPPEGKPATPPSTAPPPGAGEPEWYDLKGQVVHAIAGFLAKVAAEAIRPALDTLGRTVLATPNLTRNERVKEIWTGSVVVTNSVFVLLVVIGGFVVMTRENLQTNTGVKEIAPRLGVAALAANLSLVIIGKAIGFTNALTAAVAHRGVNPKKAAKAFEQVIKAHLAGDDVMASVLIIVVDVMAIVVVATFVLRIMLMVGLIGIAPLALACHALPQTEQIAYTWWRSLTACLVIQVAQAVVLVAALRVFLTPNKDGVLPAYATGNGLLGLLVCATTLWLMIKIPFWTKHYVLAGLQTGGQGIFRQIITTILLAKTLGRLAGMSKAFGRPGRSVPALPAATKPVRTRSTVSRTVKPNTTRNIPRRVVAPVAFSHAPTHQVPLSRPAGSGTPRFSQATSTATPRPSAVGPPAVAFSNPPARHASPTPAGSVPPVRFAPPATPEAASAPVTRAGTAAPVRFSHTAPSQVAPKRPPAPVTPTFSHAPARRSRRRGGMTGRDVNT